jgi:hypothetical protein
VPELRGSYGEPAGACAAKTTREAIIFKALRLAVTTVLILVFQGQAALAADAPPTRGPVNAGLYVKASNRYSAQLKSEGDKLQLVFSRGLFPALVYTFHGRVSAAGIRARIADLGSIDLRFKPSGKAKHGRPPRNCSGPRVTLFEGHFVGELTFRAELGVTSIDVTYAKGWIASPGWRCHASGLKAFAEQAPSDVTYTFLQALDQRDGLGFGALAGTDAEHPEANGASISASAETRRGPVKIAHLAVALAENAFSFDSALDSATVTPPNPFHGSATYCRSCAAGSQWTGDLSVRVPGIGHPIELTGARYRISLRSFVGSGAQKAARSGARPQPSRAAVPGPQSPPRRTRPAEPGAAVEFTHLGEWIRQQL